MTVEAAMQKGWVMHGNLISPKDGHVFYVNEAEGRSRVVHVFSVPLGNFLALFAIPELQVVQTVCMTDHESISRYKKIVEEKFADSISYLYEAVLD